MKGDFTSKGVPKLHASARAYVQLSGAKIIAEHDMRDLLTDMVEERGSQRAVAQELGVSQAFLGDVLHGRRGVSANLAGKLGYERVVVFVKGDTT